jgi:hypothetical protein
MTLEVFTLLAALLLAFIGVVSVVDRQRQADLQRALDGLLTRRGQEAIESLAETVDDNKYILGRYLGMAEGLRRDGRHAEAAARMAVGCAAIEGLAPDFLTAVRSLRRLTRAVSVIVSPEPISARAFRAYELRGLAGLGQALHHLLLTGRQQIALRLRLVGALFRLALRFLRGATARVARRPDHAPTWERVSLLVVDLGSAGDEAVVAARQVVQALDAVELGLDARRPAGS